MQTAHLFFRFKVCFRLLPKLLKCHVSHCSFIIIPVRLDKSAIEICKLACASAHIESAEECFLVEASISPSAHTLQFSSLLHAAARL